MRAVLVYRYIFFWGRMTTYPFINNTSSTFFYRACDFPSYWFLTRFTVPGMCSLLWSRSQANQKAVGDPYIGHATIIQVGIANSFILLSKFEPFLTLWISTYFHPKDCEEFIACNYLSDILSKVKKGIHRYFSVSVKDTTLGCFYASIQFSLHI